MSFKSLLKPVLSWVNQNVIPWLRYIWHRIENGCLHIRHELIVNCIGDSHNTVFEYIQKENLFSLGFIRSTTVIGATVLGLANPNSKTSAMPIFLREVRGLPKQQALCIMLGEIDCGFLIFLRSQRKGTSATSEMEESLNRFRDFLKIIFKLGLAKVVVCSVPPPTIRDHSVLGEVANFRREVRASIEERTMLTRDYNARLKHIVEDAGFSFMDMDKILIDPQTGLVRQDLLNSDPRDHHLALNKAAPLYADKLCDAFEVERNGAK